MYFQMAQELNMIPKSESFINPYKQANQRKKVKNKHILRFFLFLLKFISQKTLSEDDPRLNKEKKRKEKRKRGPGMSRTEL